MTDFAPVAGYRPLRRIARGTRADVWLGFEVGEAGAEEGVAPVPVALKVLTEVDPARLGHEVSAVERARGDHVARLLDLDTADGAVLVFERLPRGDLAELIARRGAIDAGEAVTILAPLASAVARMHAAGVAHGRLTASRVMFRDDGAPTIIGFGGATLFAANSAEVDLERVDAVVADRACLASLAATVLSRVSGPRAKVARQLVDRLASTEAALLTETLGRMIFELAAAVPVRFAADEEADGSPRLVPLSEPLPREHADADQPGSRRTGLGLGLGRGVGRAMQSRAMQIGPISVARQVAQERWISWTPRRRRIMVAVAATLSALVVAVIAVPGPAPATAPEVLAVPDSAEAASSAAPDSVVDADERILAEDDPLAAVAVLLERRQRCFRDLSVLCLDGVDQQGSAALDGDRVAIRAAADGDQLPDTAPSDFASPVLVERLGDSALIDSGAESKPASLLLLKGAAGWRIRDYLAGEDPDEGDS
ncbi:hypothetical protein BH11ACT3_BH11ACT3_11090 [soil metagenome]